MFFFSSRRRHTRWPRDWSSDVCSSDLKEGRFKQLEIRVQGAPVEINKMVITFGNNETFSPELRHRFEEKSTSRVIDLPGDRRTRSEERRVGKECRGRWGTDQ